MQNNTVTELYSQNQSESISAYRLILILHKDPQ